MVLFHELLRKEIAATEKAMQSMFSLNKTAGNLSAEIIKDKGGTKTDLANTVVTFISRMQNCVKLMDQTAAEIERNRLETKDATSEVIKLQKELLVCKTDQIERFQKIVDENIKSTLRTELKSYSDVVDENVKSTLKTELKSYSDVLVKKVSNGDPSLTIRNIKAVVKDAVKDCERSRSLIMFGLDDEGDESDEDLEEKVGRLLMAIGTGLPDIEAARFGRNRNEKRPVRVLFKSSDFVHRVMKAAKNLAKTDQYKRVYISMDRTPEERSKRRELVTQLKEKVRQNPSKYFYIREGKIHEEHRPTPS